MLIVPFSLFASETQDNSLINIITNKIQSTINTKGEEVREKFISLLNNFKEKAAECLKLTSDDMLKNKLIDGIVKEPLGGAHQNPELMAQTLKKQILKDLKELTKQKTDQLVSNRIDKFCAMGVVVER